MSQIQSFVGSMGPAGPILTLTGDSGGAVAPDGAGNINILGQSFPSVGFATVTDNPGTHTLSIQPIIAELSTNDGNFNTLYTLPLGANSSAVLSATIIGQASDQSICAGGFITSVGRRQAGGVTSPGSNALFNTDYVGNPAPSAIIIPSGNNLVLQVRGVAATTFNWTAQILYQFEIL